MSTATVDITEFKNAVARFASGVTVVTALDSDGKPTGFTASAFSSLSLTPPLVLVCLQKDAGCYDAFMQAKDVAISVLSVEQGDLAWQFARKDIDKFAGAPLEKGEITGLPLVKGATVQFEGRMFAKPDGGDHTILLVEVLRAVTNNDTPLLHYNRKMGEFVPQS